MTMPQPHFECIDERSTPLGLNVAHLATIMERLGVSLSPEAFQYEAARAYETIASGTRAAGLVEPALQTCHSYPVFRSALRRAGPAKRVLVLGCGEGLPGLDSEYPSKEWLEAWPETPVVDRMALSWPVLLNKNGWGRDEYDVVVSHSMLHFIYRIDLALERIKQVLRPGGMYVMGKEVNARFGRVPELVQNAIRLNQELATRKRLRSIVDFKRYYRRLGPLFATDPPLSWTEGVNLVLRRRLQTRGDLTSAELSRLVEVHRPLLPHSDQQVGMQGFDVDFLSGTYLEGFELDWFESSGYLGYQHCHQWSAKWLRQNRTLAAQHAGRGVYFSACWRLKE